MLDTQFGLLTRDRRGDRPCRQQLFVPIDVEVSLVSKGTEVGDHYRSRQLTAQPLPFSQSLRQSWLASLLA